MFNDVISLIAITEEENGNGDLIPTETKNEIFANTRSVGMKEKYIALSNGLDPEIIFVVADYMDYNNEQFVEYGTDAEENPIRYRVLRTYRKDGANQLEIVVTR